VKIFLPLLAFLTTTLFSFAADPVPATAADRAYDTLHAIRTAQIPSLGNVTETSALQMEQHDFVSRFAELFLKQFPDDSRKWEVIGWAVNSPRTDKSTAEAEAWQKRSDEMRHQLLEGKDVPDAIWVFTVERTIGANTGFRDTPVRDLKWAGQLVEEMRRRVPASDRRKFAEESYLDALAARDPAAAVAFLRSRVTADETNPSIVEMASGRLRIIDAKNTPVELTFTAADGQPVDLAKLRGKVVLIDCWATWCKPCIAEMPNVVAAYNKYHSRGFEVIGISFDKAPGAKPRAMEKTAQEVLAFAKELGMPWPQYYDGKYWDNDFSKRFSIASIPATFLLSKDGRLVTTEAHGPELATEIERLLAQK
jgi:thiol-disulfide isomerase/thioredoxin